jgi:RimJ/RimL family protein N-acetyltransferase/methionyl-tRNA formyltransferase
MWTDLPLTDDTITLRCLQRADVGAHYLGWLHDPEVNQYLEVRHALPAHVDELWQFVDGVNRSTDSLMLGIFGPDGRHIGNIKIGPANATHRRAEVGIICGDRSQWGKGYATRAIRLASHHAFAAMGLQRLTAGCYDTNLGSMRAFIKAGYRHEGTLANYWQCDGRSVGQILMGLSTPADTRQLGTLVFIGGGQLMVNTIEAARQRGLKVGAILAERHANEALSTGRNLQEELAARQIPTWIAASAAEIDPAQLGDDFKHSTALCFGPAWIFPPEVLARFQGGMLNFNGIPIPHYLGGAHYTWQILNGHRKGGCHIQRITPQVDRGDLLMSEEFDLPEGVQTPADYFRENDVFGLAFLGRFLDRFVGREPFAERPFADRNPDRLYFPRLMTLDNGWIDWSWSGDDIQAFCLAFGSPYKGASTHCNGQRIRLTRTSLLPQPADQRFHPFCAGLIVRKTADGFCVAVAGGLLHVAAFECDDGQPRHVIREGDRLFTDTETLTRARLYRPKLASSAT